MGEMVAIVAQGRVVEQLAQLGVKPEDVDIVGISHYHADHTGQAADFPNATLLIGSGDFDGVKRRAESDPFGAVAQRQARRSTPVERRQGRVRRRQRHGAHLPGPHAGPHGAAGQAGERAGAADAATSIIRTERSRSAACRRFNTDRAQTLASMDGSRRSPKNLGAKVIIQHEPADIAKLPAFPKAARMKALLVARAPGGPETLRLDELPDPVPGPGELLVRVRAAAINYPDVLIIEDKYQFRPPRPFAPGGEIAGEVEAVGEGVERLERRRPADRRAGLGGLAEKVVIPADGGDSACRPSAASTKARRCC